MKVCCGPYCGGLRGKIFAWSTGGAAVPKVTSLQMGENAKIFTSEILNHRDRNNFSYEVLLIIRVRTYMAAISVRTYMPHALLTFRSDGHIRAELCRSHVGTSICKRWNGVYNTEICQRYAMINIRSTIALPSL